MTIPSVVSNQFNQDDFCLRIMAVDFQSQMGTKPDGVYSTALHSTAQHSAPSLFLFIFYTCLCPLGRVAVVLRCTVLTIATLVVTLYTLCLRRTCTAFKRGTWKVPTLVDSGLWTTAGVTHNLCNRSNVLEDI